MDYSWAVETLFLVVAGGVLLIVVLWFFFYTSPPEQPDYDKIRGWRARKAEATSYSEMQEYRDSIEEEHEKGSKRGETPYQRLRRWWRKSYYSGREYPH
ncbi:MAG TPA: hypothetical protein VFW33_08850 [Gemmataceae bacterium]|nr:hypothetical protein [Gemmataceae bacterium]